MACEGRGPAQFSFGPGAVFSFRAPVVPSPPAPCPSSWRGRWSARVWAAIAPGQERECARGDRGRSPLADGRAWIWNGVSCLFTRGMGGGAGLGVGTVLA